MVEHRVVQEPADWTRVADLRREVFVCEQGVPEEEELDAMDAHAIHFGSFGRGELVACARALCHDDSVKIGRVAVLRSRRSEGIGRGLMEFVLSWARRRGLRQAVLDSQCAAEGFYSKLGFEPEGDVFMDAGISHIRMRLRF